MSDKDLSSAKKALLEKWLKGQHTGDEVNRIPPRPDNTSLKLSFPQQRRLFLEMLGRDTAVNNLSVFMKLSGPLDLNGLKVSAQQIMNRHETLRTRFSFKEGIPVPEVVQTLESFPIDLVDLTESPSPDRFSEAQRLAKAYVLKPIDLQQAPLIRLNVYRLEKQEHLLLIVAHHIIADGWSLGVFLKELMAFYHSQISGKTHMLPKLSTQYSDFAHWQTAEKRQVELSSSLAYWKKKLGGELPITEFPTDRARPARPTFYGGTHRFPISEDLAIACVNLGQRENATLYMTLLAVFYLVLHRYCGQEDLLIGSPIANRTVPELEPLIGVFINTIVLRTSLEGNPSFRKLLRRVREVALDAYAHQDFPFEKLVEELKPQRDITRTPLFQIVFNLQNVPLPELEIAGLETTIIDIDRGVSQFDLTLMFTKKGKEYHATVEYNADLFKASSIERMFQSYQQCLEFAVRHPEKYLSKFPILRKTDRQEMVVEFNDTPDDFPRDQCIHQLIEAQVARSPDTIAVIDGELELSYDQLNRRANKLACILRSMGVTIESRVGVLLEKSSATVEILLAILKAGGAYVPIHMSSPAERIQFIIQDAEIKVLLTNIDLDPLFSFAGQVIDLRTHQPPTEASDLNLMSPVDARNLAYVIYTSGSTGVPKGVMMDHLPVVNFLWSMKDQPGMDASSVILALTALSFDPSTLELFLPLMVGAKIVIPDKSAATNPILLAETIDRYNINILQATPVTWQLLLETGWTGKSDLTAICGGEALPRKVANKLVDKVSVLWNLYGPTEAAVWCMKSRVEKAKGTVAIGRPINNMQIYILDGYLQPVPLGVIGELHIAGVGLARAYLNHPELTEEKFIPNTFSTQPGARMYKSGDLARFLSDHRIEFIGRKDDQVKVQGNRVELEEINVVLGQHPAIGKSIVISRKEDKLTTQLTAYYVLSTDLKPTNDEIRTFLGKRLPTYMIPVYFVQIDTFPVLASGKINHKALPLPKAVRSITGYVAPRNEAEQIMAKIWGNVLEIEQVGVNDNFFELGGASIQSIQIVAKANIYGYHISVNNIFEFQTIAELVSYLNQPS